MNRVTKKLKELERRLTEIENACASGNTSHARYLVQFAKRELAEAQRLAEVGFSRPEG
jgi:hypothetical protein